MKRKLVNEIKKTKNNDLDAYVSEYFEEHLPNKKDILMYCKDYEIMLRVNYSIWALVIALDGELFDELIVDEYPAYDIEMDLRYFSCNSLINHEIIIRIALSKDVRFVYQFLPHDILSALLLSDMSNTDEIVCVFERILETQRFNQIVLKNFSSDIEKEMELLKAILKKSKGLVNTPVIMFYALHDEIGARSYLEKNDNEEDTYCSDIITLLKDKEIREKYVKIPGLFVNIIKDWNIDKIKSFFDEYFTFDEIMEMITAGEYFECDIRILRYLILHIYGKYEEQFTKFKNALLEYVNKGKFFVLYRTILDVYNFEECLSMFSYSDVFKEAVFNCHICYGLFEDFKKSYPAFLKMIKNIVRKYDIKVEYIINLIEPLIDDEDEEEINDLQKFKEFLR